MESTLQKLTSPKAGSVEGAALVDSSSLLQRFRLNQWRRIRLVTARQSFVCCLRAAER